MDMAEYLIKWAEYLIKWAEAAPLPHQTSETIARALVDQVICWHGVPQQSLSDRGANRLSAVIRDLCAVAGMSKVITFVLTVPRQTA